MTANVLNSQVTDSELARYAKLVYDRTGIRLSPQKKTLLSNRVRRRLKATGIPDFECYLNHLRKLSADAPEWDAFLQEITTHETYLFRDEGQWDWFSNQYLAELANPARKSRIKTLRIWSAACSTGDEAHTIATCIAEHLSDHAQWNIQILATDIGIGALKQAREAVFSPRAMKLVPEVCRRRYFEPVAGTDQWKAKPVLSRWIRFRQHNLLEPLNEAPLDLIFLKNVLIYFDEESKKRAIGHIRNVLKPGGMLIASAAEGITNYMKDWERVAAWNHRKPGANPSQPST